MRHVISQSRTLTENLKQLILNQESVLSYLESKEKEIIQLPQNKTYLSILVDQLSKLSQARTRLLNDHQVSNPMELPSDALIAYTEFWKQSDVIIKIIERKLKDYYYTQSAKD